MNRAYSELGAGKNPAPRIDDLKCIGDLAESQKARRSWLSFFIAVEAEGLFLFSSPLYSPDSGRKIFSPSLCFLSRSLEVSSLCLRTICSVINKDRTTFPVWSPAHCDLNKTRLSLGSVLAPKEKDIFVYKVTFLCVHVLFWKNRCLKILEFF